MYPSSSFVRGYEPVSLGLGGGEIHYGILRRINSDSVALVVGPGVEHRFATSAITEIDRGTVSLMPPGVDKMLSERELADLIAFLRSLR